VLCNSLYTSDLIPANPMPLVGRPKIAKTLPIGLPTDSVHALLSAIDSESDRRASDWMERDRVVLWILGAVGRPVGGRKVWF
jgi:site-specific recombinase XerD